MVLIMLSSVWALFLWLSSFLSVCAPLPLPSMPSVIPGSLDLIPCHILQNLATPSSLARVSIKQGEQEWWNKIKSDEKELKKVILAYKKACPDTSHGVPRGEFKISQYKEITWGEYEDFARSAAGGRLTPNQTLARWNSWKDDPSWPLDMNGHKIATSTAEIMYGGCLPPPTRGMRLFGRWFKIPPMHWMSMCPWIIQAMRGSIVGWGGIFGPFSLQTRGSRGNS